MTREALAWLMDNSIPIPGTGGRRVGLDAIIGFVPGLGDLVSSGASLFVIVRAAGHGLPPRRWPTMAPPSPSASPPDCHRG